MATEAPTYPQPYPETRQPLVLSTYIVFTALSSAAVILRFVSRRIGSVAWQRDDIPILLGWLYTADLQDPLLVAQPTYLYLSDVRYGGLGLHQSLVDPEAMEARAKFLLAISFIYLTGAVLPNLAILDVYLRSFFVHKPSCMICYATAILLLANWIANTAVGFAVCRPLSALWSAPAGNIAVHRCIDINDWFQYGRVVNIVTDVVMLVLPIPHVLGLPLKTRMKLGVLATFFFGSV
ncbi:uncharacterized protein BDV17DRAFT_294091 [Aspergillus undulatus]|uniref:uncharacterized protein n=1 Tax=Aspergillus undulatus TaxID=1810928 RepID=UPI003CCD8002